MKYACRVSLLLLLLVAAFVLKAQLPGMKAYTQLDGYPSSVGYVITQDDKGFIWIGTDNGVVRFDGSRFKIMDDRIGLADKEIIMAAPLKGGRIIFVPMLNNLSYYDNGKVFTSKEDKRLSLLSNISLNHAFKDDVTGKVWIGDDENKGELLYFDGDKINKEKIPLDKNFAIAGITNNKIYTHTVEETPCRTIGIYDTETKKFDSLLCRSNGSEWSFISPDGKFLALYSFIKNKILCFEIKENNTVQKLWERELKEQAKHIIIDKNHVVWVTYIKGGVEYFGYAKQPLQKGNSLCFLDDIIINHVFVDRDNNKWFTTTNKGLLFISENHWENALLVKQLRLPEYLPKSVCGDSNGNIYIGYNKAFYSIYDGKNITTLPLPDSSFLAGTNFIRIKKHIYLFGVNDIYTLPESGKFTPSLLLFNREGYSIKDFTFKNNNELVIATHNGIYTRNLLVNSNPHKSQPLFPGRGTSLFANNNLILIGTPNGLLYSYGTEKITKIKHPDLSDTHITYIAGTANGWVLIGTSVKGLFCYQPETGKIKHIKNTSLPHSSFIKQIYIQNDSTCWLATGRGVFNITFNSQMKVKEVSKYTFLNGLSSNNITSLYVQNDTLFVTTALGLSILPLKRFSKNTSSPPQGWITQAQIGKTIFHFPKQLHLTHKQTDIQLSLSAISYESIGNIRYQYKLEGLSENWVETENSEINFSGLPPGEYKLLVTAINFKGIKSDTQLALPIIITPALWQTVWFKWLIGFLLAIIIGLVVFKLVVNAKNKQYGKILQKRRLAELELEAIKAQINPHFIYNCLNSIQYFSYKNDYEPVNTYLDLFAKLIRQTMQYSQETFITLDEEIDYLSNYLKLEKVRFKEKLNYYLEIEENISGDTLIPAMLIQPYIENALKHGVTKLRDNSGRVWIKITQNKDGWLHISIEDNGPGIQPAKNPQKKTHLGMRLAGSRVDTYNQLFGLNIRINIVSGSIENNDTVQGVKVELLIPPITHEHTTF